MYRSSCIRAWVVRIREVCGKILYFNEEIVWGLCGDVKESFFGESAGVEVQILENNQVEKFGIQWGNVIGMVS